MEEYQYVYINSILFQFYENLLEKTGRGISFFFFFFLVYEYFTLDSYRGSLIARY